MITSQAEKSHLQAWAEEHEPAKDLIYKDGYWEQVIFVRDKITGLLATSYDEYMAIRANLKAVSAHTSKSVRLPVFQIELADGTTFTMRYNFYDWKVSVRTTRDVEADFMGLFKPDQKIHSVYCEGFPEELVYGSYAENQKQFTIEIHDDYQLYMFFWIFANQVLGKRNREG